MSPRALASRCDLLGSSDAEGIQGDTGHARCLLGGPKLGLPDFRLPQHALLVLLGIGLLIGAGYLVVIGAVVALTIVVGLWPAIVGIGLGVLLGTFGFTNAGVLVVPAGIGGEIFWLRKGSSDSGGSSEPSRKTLYNKDGDPIGYVDE